MGKPLYFDIFLVFGIKNKRERRKILVKAEDKMIRSEEAIAVPFRMEPEWNFSSIRDTFFRGKIFPSDAWQDCTRIFEIRNDRFFISRETSIRL